MKKTVLLITLSILIQAVIFKLTTSFDNGYNLMPIAVLFTIVYIVMRLLLKFKKISLLTHRQLWNLMLLESFLGLAFLGVLLVLRPEFGTVIDLPFNTLFWHIEIGIAMLILCVFHIVERWYFFKTMIMSGR